MRITRSRERVKKKDKDKSEEGFKKRRRMIRYEGGHEGWLLKEEKDEVEVYEDYPRRMRNEERGEGGWKERRKRRTWYLKLQPGLHIVSTNCPT